jgi:hypothetical protein
MNTVHGGALLAAGLALTDMSVMDLWGAYLALGGSHTRQELGAYLRSEGVWSAVEHDMVAHALNEYISGQGLDHPVSYSDEV